MVASPSSRAYAQGTMFRGSDIRIGSGVICDPRVWPRRQVQAWRWKWKAVLSYPLHEAHINGLELQAILAALKWRLGKRGHCHKRFVHLTDSFICLAIPVKVRTSSRVLQRVVRKIDALVLASSLVPAYGHTRSRYNPADAPSRWRHDSSRC